MTFGTFHLYSLPPWLSDGDVIHQELVQAQWLEELGFNEACLAEHSARICCPAQHTWFCRYAALVGD